jgi:hypothetical protein
MEPGKIDRPTFMITLEDLIDRRLFTCLVIHWHT